LNALLKFFKSKTTLFITLPIFFYLSVFNTFIGNKLFNSIAKFYPKAILTGDVKKFSLLYGVQIDELTISEPNSSKDDYIFKCDSLKLFYNLPRLITGDLILEKIELFNPTIKISKINGIWNYQKILPNPQEKIEEDSTTENLNAIQSFIPISFFIDLSITNLSFQIREESNYFFQINEFSLNFLLKTIASKNIPLNLEILDLISVLQLNLSPNNYFNLHFDSEKIKFDHKPNFNISFIQDNDKKIYTLFLILELYDFFLVKNNKKIEPFNFSFKISSNYNPKIDTFQIENFIVDFQKERWINANGFIKEVQSNNPNIDIVFEKTLIQFSKLTNYLNKNFQFSEFKLDGIIDIRELKIYGNKDNLLTTVSTSIPKFEYITKTSTHLIKNLNLSLRANLDLNDKISQIPFLKSLILDNLELNYNNSNYLLNLIYKKEENVNAKLKIYNLKLNDFSSKINGSLDSSIELSGTNLSNLSILLDLTLKKFQFPVGDKKSKLLQINSKAEGNIIFLDKFKIKQLDIRSFYLDLLSINSELGLNLIFDGNYNFLDQNITLNKFKSTLYLDKLLLILPYTISEKLYNTKKILGNQIIINTTLKYSLNDTKKLNFNSNLVFPGINLPDLNLEGKVELNHNNNQSILIEKLSLNAYESKLFGMVNGVILSQTINNETKMNPNLDISLSLNSNVPDELTKNLLFQGNINITLNLSEDRISGNAKSIKSNLYISGGKCPGAECKIFKLSSINFNIPLEHEFKSGYVDSILGGDKSRMIKAINRTEDNNFSIYSIEGPHPFLESGYFDYVQGTQSIPGISGRIEYINNLLSIPNLKMNLLNGNIIGKDLLFNLKNINPTEMEYNAFLQIKDIDLKELLSDVARKNIDNGKITGDINLSGKNLEDPIQNMEMYLSVFKIGKDFGKSAINVISPPNLIRDYIVNSYSVENIEIQLTKGLVYANILFKPGLLPTLFTQIEDNKISQERMPLANFLNRAKSELSNYGSNK
jgi:hypothetical protein